MIAAFEPDPEPVRNPASGKDLAASDAARLLYNHGIGSIGVSLFASTFLLLISADRVASRSLWAWWSLMMVVLVARGLDALRWHRRSPAMPASGNREIRRFGLGLVAAAILWAAFPLLFFSKLDPAARATATIILCGMAGGGATVLAPSQSLALIFCSALIWPATLIFLLSHDFQSRLLGILGCVFFVVMAVSSRLTHRAAMTAIRLSRANEALAREVTEEHKRTEGAHSELKTAEAALRDANQLLEFRIRLRTSDLEREIREKERYAKELAHLASTDLLTGLSNRARLVDHLKEKLSGAGLSASNALAVLFIDLDKFKEVNDVMGHDAGDRVLQIAARRLASALPPNVHVSRWGGDEFVVVLPDPQDTEAAIRLAAALRTVLCDPIEVDLETVSIDATVGVALFPEHGRNYDELIRAADVAMYAGKEEKRSKVRLFDPALSRKLVEHHLLEQALREAIPAKAFSLVFEPIIFAPSGHCGAMEALLRWHHPDYGTVGPSTFIPLAERTGDILAIGRWVLREACREAVTWPGVQPPAVSVNMSAAQILSDTFIRDVYGALADTGLPAHRLQLELTETQFAGDHAATSSVLAQLRRSGIRISLDDFGTGFSSLSYLRNLPIDSIKIDRSFVAGIHADSRPIVKAILTTAEALGLKAIAEGIETTAQAETLISMGAEYLQGFLFIESPLTPQGARDWLGRQTPLPTTNWTTVSASATEALRLLTVKVANASGSDSRTLAIGENPADVVVDHKYDNHH
ncbi:MAG TPA: EAL domain-containing protein [Bryobacteraceae bacterium]|jgi:diguanylate cyclase (GGDEF)-like protein